LISTQPRVLYIMARIVRQYFYFVNIISWLYCNIDDFALLAGLFSDLW